MNIPSPRKQETLDSYVARVQEQGVDPERASLYWNLDWLWWKAMKAQDVDALRTVLVDVIEFQKQMLELDP